MAGELIQKEEKLEDIVRILEEENETEYKIIYPQIQKQKTILTCCITGTGTAEQIRLLIIIIRNHLNIHFFWNTVFNQQTNLWICQLRKMYPMSCNG